MAQMTLNVGIKGLKTDTNIMDIKVPDALRRRIKTGVTWFDDAVGGDGFVPSSVMMLTGTPGAGKTTMLLQLADSITKSGNICLYNTGEESLYQVRMVTERLKLAHGFVCGQDIMVPELLEHADKLRKANPKKQVFILQDSLQTLDDGKYGNGTNGSTPLRCVEMLTDWAKSNYGIVTFIGQVNKSGEFSGKNGILHAIDIKGSLYIDQEKNSETYGERIFEITKNRFGCSGRAYVLGYQEKGLFEKGSFGMGTKLAVQRDATTMTAQDELRFREKQLAKAEIMVEHAKFKVRRETVLRSALNELLQDPCDVDILYELLNQIRHERAEEDADE